MHTDLFLHFYSNSLYKKTAALTTMGRSNLNQEVKSDHCLRFLFQISLTTLGVCLGPV